MIPGPEVTKFEVGDYGKKTYGEHLEVNCEF